MPNIAEEVDAPAAGTVKEPRDTAKPELGLVVPIPTLPLESMRRRSAPAVTSLTTKAFDEIRITAENKTKRSEIEISKLKLDQKGLERIPSYGAENDIVGAFSVTPGVITTGDQGGQLYVRGGTPIQNKVLLDGMTIYNPFHSIGFFSIFETELVKNVDIYTGGFESKYGGRISSVMDITYRDCNRK